MQFEILHRFRCMHPKIIYIGYATCQSAAELRRGRFVRLSYRPSQTFCFESSPKSRAVVVSTHRQVELCHVAAVFAVPAQILAVLTCQQECRTIRYSADLYRGVTGIPTQYSN